jgi:hypothetical protein
MIVSRIGNNAVRPAPLTSAATETSAFQRCSPLGTGIFSSESGEEVQCSKASPRGQTVLKKRQVALARPRKSTFVAKNFTSLAARCPGYLAFWLPLELPMPKMIP